MDNEMRIYAAERAVEVHAGVKGPDKNDEVLFSDLLADLMHFAQYHEIDFANALLSARIHFKAETASLSINP